MNTLPPLRLAMLAAIALSPFGLASQAIAAPGSVVVPTVPVTRPVSSPVVIPTATQPQVSSPVVVPVYQPPKPATLPPVSSPNRLPPIPNVTNRPSSSGSPSNNSALIYRVVVASNSTVTQERVKQLVPNAFRTSVNGQSMIQAGLFREQNKAVELQQLLNRNNVSASVLSTPANSVNLNPTPTTPPSRSGAQPLPSVPKSGTIVVIDPGHGGGDPGAVGVRGLEEAAVTLEISRQVVSLLKQQGVEAVLTRNQDVEIDLEPRVQFAERANADVFVSIHANSFDANRTDVNGVETYYYSGGDGQRLAQLVQTNLVKDVGARDRGVKTANFYVIKYTNMPAILVEVGFVTGAEDAARLSSSNGRNQIAQAIAKGILQYLK